MDEELLLKYIKGDCTEPEKIVVTNWIDSSPNNMKEYITARKLYDFTIWQTPITAEVGQKKQKFQRKIYQEIFKVAAVLAVGFLITRYVIPGIYWNNSVTTQKLHVPAGQRAEITLVDGTHVWLNAQTTLEFPSQFNTKVREVHLDGEAFFDVTADKSHPFIIKSKKYDVKVWGTKLNLKTYSKINDFETSLFEGSVEIIKSGEKKGIFIHPNQRGYLVNNQLITGAIMHNDQFLWKEGIISFNDETFEQIVNKLKLYYEIKIQVNNKKLLKYRLTGKFRVKDGIEHILKVIQLRYKFSYTIDEKINSITIN